MATIALSQFLPALTLLRSARSSVWFHNRAIVATPAAKLSPRRTHAFGQSQRPDDAKRHTDVMTKLKMIGAIRRAIEVRMGHLRSHLTHFGATLCVDAPGGP